MRWVVVSIVLLLSPTLTFAQLSAERFSAPPPDSIAAPIRSLLSSDAVKATIGATTLEFWWANALPGAWDQIAEGTVIGAVRLAAPFKEIRGKTVKPGVYTLRYGLQPQNGDHLGASPFREYLLLSPAAVDVDAKPLGFDGTVAISKQTLGASHPAAFSIDPPAATGAVLSTHTTDLDHKALIFEIKTTKGAPLKFGVVLVGFVEH